MGSTTGVMYLTATAIHDNDEHPVDEAPQGTRVAIPVEGESEQHPSNLKRHLIASCVYYFQRTLLITVNGGGILHIFVFGIEIFYYLCTLNIYHT